jgi:hypothetical protein
MTWGIFRPGRHGRLRRIEERVGRPQELRVGGGRAIVLSPLDRCEMLTAAIRQEDHPLLDAVRSGAGEEERDELAELLGAFEGGDGPPSGDAESPWVYAVEEAPTGDIEGLGADENRL